MVLDPVMVATSGDRLLNPDAIDVLKRVLIPRALVITPNLPEAAALLDEPLARNEDEMLAQAGRLRDRGAQAVLIKGGHGDGAESVDMLVLASSFTRLATPRIDTRNTHGTGCTLSSAIAAGLAKGLDLVDCRARGQGLCHRGDRGIEAADGRFRPRAGAPFPQVVVTRSTAVEQFASPISRELSARHTVEAAAVWLRAGPLCGGGVAIRYIVTLGIHVPFTKENQWAWNRRF